MALKTSTTVLIHVPQACVIKVTPERHKRVSIKHPHFCHATDRKGVPLDQRRKKKRA